MRSNIVRTWAANSGEERDGRSTTDLMSTDHGLSRYFSDARKSAIWFSCFCEKSVRTRA